MNNAYIDDFALFVKQTVKRYSQSPYNVKYYEIWNEPDGPKTPDHDKPWGCWGTASDPYYGGEYYAKMLGQVYPAVKAANPDAKVVMGGLLLSCDPRKAGSYGYCETDESWKKIQPKFLEGILKYARDHGGNYFDYINFHGYNYFTENLSAIESERLAPLNASIFQANGGQVEGKLDYIHYLFNKYHYSKPIILSEAGLLFNATPTAEFEETKADYVVYLFTRNIAIGIDVTTWYTLDSGWRNSGFLAGEGKAYDAYKVLTSTLEGAEYIGDINPTSGVIGFSFKKGDNTIWVLFSEDGTNKTINKPANISNVYDLYHNPIDISGTTITFDRPIYIEFVD
jgi:hypothetical protein